MPAAERAQARQFCELQRHGRGVRQGYQLRNGPDAAVLRHGRRRHLVGDRSAATAPTSRFWATTWPRPLRPRATATAAPRSSTRGRSPRSPRFSSCTRDSSVEVLDSIGAHRGNRRDGGSSQKTTAGGTTNLGKNAWPIFRIDFNQNLTLPMQRRENLVGWLQMRRA
jgi:hypothetical protein